MLPKIFLIIIPMTQFDHQILFFLSFGMVIQIDWTNTSFEMMQYGYKL